MGCSCNKVTNYVRSNYMMSSSSSSGWSMDSVLSYVNCMECAVSGVITGAMAYYFVPGSASTSAALQIAGVSFVSQLMGKYVTANYMSS